MRWSGLIAAVTGTMAVFAIASPSLPQSSKPDSSVSASSLPETVVVTGLRPPREQRDKIVWNFVYSHAKLAPKIDQLSRWVSPLCPHVQNLPKGYADFIINRIKSVSEAIGAPVREPCQPNVEIIFTSDPQAFMDSVAGNNPKMLGFHYVHETKSIATVTKPIQAWYVTATSNRVKTYIDDPYHAAPAGSTGSRISHGQLSVFDYILIVANTNKVAGYPVGEIADYLAMLSLSEADAPGDCVELPSILDLMSPDCALSQKPESLTSADKTYLEGMYAMDPDEIGSLQRSAISEHMALGLGKK
jgi:hypothetical protein